MAISNPHIHDWNPFPTVTIGSQIWSARNIDWKLDIPNKAWWPNHLEERVNDYGILYNWNGVIDILAIYPGWHLPTESEVNTLLSSYGGVSIAGGHLKAVGTDYWLSPNSGADNSSGFNARGAGMNGTNFKISSLFWMDDYDENWGRYFKVSYDQTNVYIDYCNKWDLANVKQSIRLIKD